jgi:hypothetical protein
MKGFNLVGQAVENNYRDNNGIERATKEDMKKRKVACKELYDNFHEGKGEKKWTNLWGLLGKDKPEFSIDNLDRKKFMPGFKSMVKAGVDSHFSGFRKAGGVFSNSNVPGPQWRGGIINQQTAHNNMPMMIGNTGTNTVVNAAGRKKRIRSKSMAHF